MSYKPTLPSATDLLPLGLYETWIIDSSVADKLGHALGNPALNWQVNAWFVKPADCLYSLRWYPFNVYDQMKTTTSFVSAQVSVGGCLLNDVNNTSIGSGYKISGDFRTKLLDFGSISIPAYSNDFRAFEPYSTAQIYIPYFGWFNIPLQSAYDGQVHLYIAVDLMTGYANAYVTVIKSDVTPTLEYVVVEASKKIGIDIPVTYTDELQNQQRLVVNGASALGQAIVGGLAGASTGGTAGMIAGIVTPLVTGAVKSAVDYNIHPESSGSFGTFVATYDPQVAYVKILHKRNTIIQSNIKSAIGLPLGEVKTLSSLTGFTQVSKVNVTLTGTMTETEANEIESLLKTGVIL